MKSRLTRFFRRLRKRRRGQAMVSYAVISAVILLGVSITGFLILPKVMNAIDTFVKSLYFGINAPIP